MTHTVVAGGSLYGHKHFKAFASGSLRTGRPASLLSLFTLPGRGLPLCLSHQALHQEGSRRESFQGVGDFEHSTDIACGRSSVSRE